MGMLKSFDSSYIARMLGELLEDVDPCETVEYVLPLLNGFAMDEGKWNLAVENGY